MKAKMIVTGLASVFLTTFTVRPGAVLAQETTVATHPVSLSHRINQTLGRASPTQPMLQNWFARSVNGSYNNLYDGDMGAAYTPLLRLVPPDYADGVSTLAGSDRPSARVVSNAVNAQDESIPNPLFASDFLWQWGQFLHHEIVLTDGADPREPANIPVPTRDPYFDPDGTGTEVITFNRSIYDISTGTDTNNPREQLNEVTAWIDASNIYGFDPQRAAALRTNDNTGRLKTSKGNLLPFNTDGLPNAGGTDAALFLAGDVRANEQVGLTALHTLFVREHNRLADLIAERNPSMSGNEIYEKARQLVGAQLQVITYGEYLPALLGPGAIAPYRGYDPGVNARISNLFSTGAYFYWHSALSPTLLRFDGDGNEIAAGHLALRDAFFAPQRITDDGGIEPLLRGLASQVCQAIDSKLVDDVRNFLFGEPGAGGFDQAAHNIQRGRDHGLPSYNDTRVAIGLEAAKSFADINADPDIQARLAAVYDSVDDIDFWVAGLAEDPYPGAQVGELFYMLLKDQFEALRDGDRFWYALTLTPGERNEVENTRLADINRRNSEIGHEIPDNVFYVLPNFTESG